MYKPSSSRRSSHLRFRQGHPCRIRSPSHQASAALGRENTARVILIEAPNCSDGSALHTWGESKIRSCAVSLEDPWIEPGIARCCGSLVVGLPDEMSRRGNVARFHTLGKFHVQEEKLNQERTARRRCNRRRSRYWVSWGRFMRRRVRSLTRDILSSTNDGLGTVTG